MQDSTGPALLRIPLGRIRVHLQGSHLLWRLLPKPSIPLLRTHSWSYNPGATLHSGLGCSPFARHYLGNHCCSLFLLLLRCFSSEGSPVDSRHIPEGMGCPIRTSADQRFFATPRSFSQLCTSFFASWCQGIHRMPLLTFLFRAGTPGSYPCGSKPPGGLLTFFCLYSHYVKEPDSTYSPALRAHA